MVALFPHLGDSFGHFLPLSSALAHPLLIWQLGGPQEWMTPYIVGPTTQLVAEIRNICSWVFSSYASWLIWLPPNPLVIKSEGPFWILCGPFLVHFWDILSSWPHLCSPGNFSFFSSSPPWKAGDQQILGPPWTLVCPLWRILANSSAQQFLLSLQGFPHRKRVTCINPAGGREEALIVIIARYNC